MCGHTEKSNYGLNLSIILMFLTIYGVEKSQCDRSNSGKMIIHDHASFRAATIFDILMHPMHEEQKHRHSFTC